MIPKVIHYIWLGGKPLPKIAKKCIKSWKKFCPDYEIKRWDESNLDLNKYQFAKEAYEAKKFAFVSDVFRTEILYNCGGVYFDIDVELIKSIDKLIDNYDCVMAFEDGEYIAPGLVFASKEHNEDLKNILENYMNLKYDKNRLSDITVCRIYTEYYKTKGLLQKDVTQVFDKNICYASEYFCPIDYKTMRKTITKNTHAIHWYCGSWLSLKQRIKKTLKKLLMLASFCSNSKKRINNYEK